MKKLFLTSGIIACMACPAFADPGFTATAGAVAVDAGDGACVNEVIGTYAESTTLVANWTPSFSQMLLNENDGTTDGQGGAATGNHYNNSGNSNAELWLTPYDSSTGQGTGVYSRSGSDTTSDPYVFTALTTSSNAIAVPAGIDVTYNVTSGLPTNTSSMSGGVPTSDNRIFMGYYAYNTSSATALADTSGTLKLIDENGRLTSDGIAAVTGNNKYNNNQQWIAHYALAQPTVSAPSAYGYSFDGWHVGSDTSTLVSTATVNTTLRGSDTNLTGVWTPKSWSVTYDCGEGTGTVTQDSQITFDDTYTWASNDDTANGSGCKVPGKHFTGWTCTIDSTYTTTGETITVISNEGTGCGDQNHTNPASCTGTTTDSAWTQGSLLDTAVIECEAQYANNVIEITWTNSADGTTIDENQCTYSGNVTIPANPRRTGYVFTGWTVQE